MRQPNLQTPVAFQTALVGTDFSPAAGVAFCFAQAIAARYQAELYVAHVISLDVFDLIAHDSISGLVKKARDKAHEKITQLCEQLPTDRCHPVVAEGDVAEVLADIVRRNHIDLVVVGTHGRRAFKKLILGSVAEEIFRTASCPVLTVGPKTSLPSSTGNLRHVLYPLEFVPDTSEAASYAASLAERYGADLTVMNIREQTRASASVDEAIDEPGKATNEPVEHWINNHISPESDLRTRIRFERGFGPAVEAILEFVKKSAVDLIVMPIKRLDPVISAHLPKSDTAYEIASRAPCPLLTVRA